MLKRDAAVRGAWAAAVILAGACADNPVTEPSALDGSGSLFANAPDHRGAFTGTLDHEFVRISREIPGFGGMFYDASGTLNVVMASAAPPMPPGDLERRLASRLEALGQPARAAQGLRVREGRYDFAELFEMRQRVDQVVWSLRGVVYTDADEAANRVTIGVEDAAALASVGQAVAMLGIPSEAVHVRTTEPLRSTASAAAAAGAAPQSSHTLQDRVRPVAGGLALHSSAPFFGFCGMGFNVRSPEAPGVHGFVTHAFCSTHPYGTGPLGTSFWQPHPQVPESLIGHEAHNAPPFTDGACPPSSNPDWRGCRWSTAAGGRYAPGVPNAFGQIYRTTGLGSIQIDPDRPMFAIVDEIPTSVLGQEVHKVGASTGWTQGTVDTTCANAGHSWFTPDGNGAIVVLCIDRAAMPSSYPFDWGGPVFVRAGEADARLLGLVSFSGSFTWFSPMNQVRLENPPPAGRTWRTHP